MTYVVGCFVNGTTEIQFGFDSEELLYADFQTEEIVYTVPAFIDPDPDQLLIGLSLLRDALTNKQYCLAYTALAEKEEDHQQEEKGKNDPHD